MSKIKTKPTERLKIENMNCYPLVATSTSPRPMIIRPELPSFYTIPGIKQSRDAIFASVAKIVCYATDIEVEDLRGKGRKGLSPLAKSLFCFICRMYHGVHHSYVQQYLSYNDHSSVVRGVKQITNHIRFKDQLFLNAKLLILKQSPELESIFAPTPTPASVPPK